MLIHVPKRVFALALATSLGVFQLAGCASGPHQRSTGQTIDDTALTARVKSAIASDAGAGTAARVNVTTYRGTVQLSGFVDSTADVQRVAAIAKDVDGVRSVENDLHVTPAGTGSR